ncbi:MAG: nitroreductase family protein, partial [Alistipes sp.]
VPPAIIGQLLESTLSAPSARNTRTTKLLVVEDHAAIVRMAAMRDYGSAFLTAAPLVIVVLGETAKSDLWRENCAIAATFLQLACVDAGLASCWVHINGRPRVKTAPDAEQASDYLRAFLPIPSDCEALCAIAIGYSDFSPAELPPFDKSEKIIRL